MTREEEIWYERRRELLQMIREAGISTGGHPMNPLQAYPEQFERFAALVYELVIKHEREKEREECAKLCEEIRKDSLFVEQHMVGKCIEAIRARNV